MLTSNIQEAQLRENLGIPIPLKPVSVVYGLILKLYNLFIFFFFNVYIFSIFLITLISHLILAVLITYSVV